jgi:uncharacterized YigZ family protein
MNDTLAGPNAYKVPARMARAQLSVHNSRFIATINRVTSVDEARGFIAGVKREFPDAHHNVAAFIIGHGNTTTTHSTDDGEPAGTAGRPALAALKGSGFGDIAVVVTRYFGGTKLGSGGLVRAYRAAVQKVLAVTPTAEKALSHTILVEVPYSWLTQVRILIQKYSGVILNETFTQAVTITARFKVQDFIPFQESMSQTTKGSLRAEIVETEAVILTNLV